MEVHIESRSDLDREVRVVAELARIRSSLNLEGLEWTDHVIVQAFVRSHSHPVLTVNTLNTGDALLSTYLHEQLHWWLADHPGTLAAVHASEHVWPVVPHSVEDGGARGELSTRLHLFVCFLTHAAMTEVVGSSRAAMQLDRLIASNMYGWVQHQVSASADEIGRLCSDHHLWPKRLDPGK